MERKEFIRCCALVSLGLPLSLSLLQGCGSIYYATATLENNRILVSRSEFLANKGSGQDERRFVVIAHKSIAFPICLIHLGDGHYQACLLECTHKSCELHITGNAYVCPCHGSEFTLDGRVLNGPADRDLATFKTSTDNEKIIIHLA